MAFSAGRGAPAVAALTRLAPALLASALALASCGRAILYPDPQGPRFEQSAPARHDPEPALRIVTFNIQYARRIDEAIGLLREDPRLRDADVLFLQEMDGPGTRRIAEALGMSFLYFPAVVHPKVDHDFGNAIVSRWPIRDGRKVILPHLARFSGSQRVAVTGTVDVGGEPVRLYSLHVALPYTVGGKGQRDQLRAVLDDAAGWTGRIIIAGDFNSHGLGRILARTGYAWPSQHVGSTSGRFDVDQVFLRGFRLAAPESIGAVRENRGASDHRPVWAVLATDTVPALPRGGYRFARPDSSFPIKRFAWLDSTLARGARPGSKGLRALHERGFRTVIDFAGTSGEQALAEAESLEYVPLPLTAHVWSSPPTEEQVRRFFEIVLDPARQPVFIHCVHGMDRTGAMAALYRIEAQGWQPPGAIEEMRLLGYHDWYNDLVNYVRDYKPRGYTRPGGDSLP